MRKNNCSHCKELEAKIHSNMVGFVEAISAMMEYRDPYTGGHQLRVAQLAKAIAVKLGMDAVQADCIELIAGMHDIGKIKTPLDLLASPAELSNAEHLILAEHPIIGYNILSNVDFTCNPHQVCATGNVHCILATAVKQHHERLDGSGYPEGITKISDEALIIAVADTVEAMVSHRPYRPALGLETALREVIRHKGVKYWGKAVEACLDVFNDDGFVFFKNGRLRDDVRV